MWAMSFVGVSAGDTIGSAILRCVFSQRHYVHFHVYIIYIFLIKKRKISTLFCDFIFFSCDFMSMPDVSEPFECFGCDVFCLFYHPLA